MGDDERTELILVHRVLSLDRTFYKVKLIGIYILLLTIIYSGCGRAETPLQKHSVTIETDPAIADTVEASQNVTFYGETSESEAVEPAREYTIVMVGDVLLHTPVEESCKQPDGNYDYESLFTHTKDEISAADLALVNQEVIIGGADLGITGYPSFNADFSLCDSLVDAGFDIICHATNHAMDKGRKGLINCAKYWKENYPQITVLGIHDTADTSTSCGAEPVILDLPDMKIAVLNYTYGTNGIPLPDDMLYAVDLPDGEQIVADIQRAEESADFFFVKHFFLKKRQNSPFSSREIPCFRWVIFIYTSLRMRACSIR